MTITVAPLVFDGYEKSNAQHIELYIDIIPVTTFQTQVWE